MTRTLLLVVTLLAPAAGAAPAQCLGTGGALVILDDTLVVSLAPDGFENQVKATLCQPLIQRPGILFDYSSWDIGVFNYVSPIYDLQGVTVGVVPLSFLELRVDAAAIGVWTLPLEGAGYYALPGYGADVRTMPAADARGSVGANVTLSARLQGEVPLFNDVLVVTNTFQVDYWYLKGGGHYFNPRRDVVLARSDYVLKNIATALIKVRMSDTVGFQLGAQDDLTVVPGSGHVVNVIGLFLSLPVRRAGALRDLEPFVRLGAYTHGERTGFQLFGGLSLAWGWKPR